MATTNVYVLRLSGGNYYVGKSANVMQRYQQHLDGTGAAWTKKHKPVALEKTYEKVSPFDEDKYTKIYMAKYGIDKVRGGSYVETELSANQIEALNNELRGAKDLCTQCGRGGHFAKTCNAKTDASGNKIGQTVQAPKLYKQAYSYTEDTDTSDEDTYEVYEWGCDYCDRTFTTAFGCGVHEKSCKYKSAKSPVYTKKGSGCYRCGSSSHYSPDCYAKRNVNGAYLD
jgi:hypothetical protein